jgi:hypothetical protein
MLCVVYAVWVPWAKRTFSRFLGFFSFGIAVTFLLAYLAVGQFATPKYLTLFETLSHNQASPERVSEEIWLQHLIATSDYRIDRLEEEREHAPNEDVRERVERNLADQRKAQEGQRAYLAGLTSD